MSSANSYGRNQGFWHFSLPPYSAYIASNSVSGIACHTQGWPPLLLAACSDTMFWARHHQRVWSNLLLDWGGKARLFSTCGSDKCACVDVC